MAPSSEIVIIQLYIKPYIMSIHVFENDNLTNYIEI